MSQVAVRLESVDVWFAEGPHVLHGVDLEVRPGEHWALLGPNGAGKSTLLAVAGAQRHPSQGVAHVLGETLGRTDMRDLRARIGTVDPRLRIPARLTVHRYVMTGATGTVLPLDERYDDDTRARSAELLALVGLAGLPGREIGVCSQGEVARARLARALVPRPRLVLLDEPASGLDLPGREDLLRALERLAADDRQRASITVAHHLEELPATTTHVALLRGGRLVAAGPTTLLRDEAALTACFGRPVRVHEADGRWWARALRD